MSLGAFVRSVEEWLLVSRRLMLCLTVCLLSLGPWLQAQGVDESGDGSEKGDLSDISKEVLRGRIVCLAESMHEIYDTHLPTNHEHLYGFRTTNGEFYTILRTKLSEAIFVDQRVRDRELVLSVRVIPKSRVIDVITMKSVKDGVVHDLHYYCFICAIRTVDPAICLCCQEAVEFMEVPLE